MSKGRGAGWLSLLVAMFVLTSVRTASAEDEGFDPVWWRPVAGGEGTASGVVQDRGPESGDVRTGVDVSHARQILVARDRDLDPRRAFINQRTTMWLLAALRVARPFELMLDQPIYLTQSYNDAPLFDALDSPRTVGIGDTRLGASLRLARSERGWFRGFGVAAFAFAPIGRDRAFQGEPFRYEPRLWLDAAAGPYTRASINLSWLVRERQTVPGVEVNDAFGWGVLVSHELGRVVSLVAEVDGQVIVGVDNFRPVHLPTEVRAGGAFHVGATTVTAGIGAGVVRGVGTSAVTGNLQIRTDVQAIHHDRDRDGLEDAVDDCPDDPEDFDLIDDEDGCPDADVAPPVAVDPCRVTADSPRPDIDGDLLADECDSDMDGDGILNDDDNCVRTPNPGQDDTDGNGQGDACSEDRDGDGVVDRSDGCPTVPEDPDLFDDADGCPEPDNDVDGLLDAVDGCPDVAEDPDLFDDTDGCPDVDNDGDGIADVDDQCPNDPEDVDGDRDDDGCPDAQSYATMQGDQIVISQQINFELDSAVITGDISFEILDDVAEILLENPTIAVRVEGHTDSQGTANYNQRLSAGRAESVRAYLQRQGVGADRLEAVGFGEDQPLADNATEPGRALNRRVEFHIVRR